MGHRAVRRSTWLWRVQDRSRPGDCATPRRPGGNVSKTCGRSCFGIPGAAVADDQLGRPVYAPSTSTVRAPAGEYWTALLSRISRTCLSRRASPLTTRPGSHAISSGNSLRQGLQMRVANGAGHHVLEGRRDPIDANLAGVRIAPGTAGPRRTPSCPRPFDDPLQRVGIGSTVAEGHFGLAPDAASGVRSSWLTPPGTITRWRSSASSLRLASSAGRWPRLERAGPVGDLRPPGCG